jgi:hypothetical protein
MYKGINCYTALDGPLGVPGPKVFLSHRNHDKPVVRSLARLLSALDVHYWLDERDQDVARAVALGLVGDSALVHAIERGVNHCTALLGLLSPRTQGSWWVPYEIGYSRAAQKQVSFVSVRPSTGETLTPEFVRTAAVYWSIDEIARWASTLAGHDLHHSDLSFVDQSIYDELAQYLPSDPPTPDLESLCKRALAAIDLVDKPEVQSELRLTTDTFEWLPSRGGAVREIAYDLMAPLAYYQLGLPTPLGLGTALQNAYDALTDHYAIARTYPPLAYEPECHNWKRQRYITPDRTWLQGLRPDQLSQRLGVFLSARDRRGGLRLATREEFKAEFDRVLKSNDEPARRSLGVFLNPLFGFTPGERPVYARILMKWRDLYSC